MNDMSHNRQHSKRLNLGEYETEEDVLDAIEQSRRITRLIISAVQKGSKFEVSQILEHYGLAMTSRLHFKVVNIVMEQWFSLMGIDDEEQIWNILRKNPYAMGKLTAIADRGTMVMSDLLTEWELPIGSLQSKIIRRIKDYIKLQTELEAEKKKQASGGAGAAATGAESQNKNNKSEKDENEDGKNNKNEKQEKKAEDKKDGGGGASAEKGKEKEAAAVVSGAAGAAVEAGKEKAAASEANNDDNKQGN